MAKHSSELRYRWDDGKNNWLRQERGFGFEDVVLSLEEFGPLDDIPHPSSDYPHQRIIFVVIQGYVVAVPYVTDNEGIFFKTAYASRRARKQYLNPENNDNKNA